MAAAGPPLPDPIPYSGDRQVPITELVANDEGLLVQSELAYAKSFVHADEFVRATHVPRLREIGDMAAQEIDEIALRGIGSRPSLAGLAVHENLVFAKWGSRGLVLDLYVPDGDARMRGGAAVPVILILHGGGWIQNSHRTYRNFAMKLAKRGYATACVEYRLTGEATYPAAIYDAKAAIRWTRANADRYGLDPDRIALLGASAGGQLAALTSFTFDDARYERPANYGAVNHAEYSSAVKALLLLDGFVNAPVSELWRNHNNDPGLLAETTPSSRVIDGMATTLPSILIVNGKPKLIDWLHEHRPDVTAEIIATALPHAYELVDGEQATVIGWIDEFLKRELHQETV